MDLLKYLGKYKIELLWKKKKKNNLLCLGDMCFKQTVEIPMSTICIPLLTYLILYSCEVDFTQGLLKKNKKKPVWSFNFMFCYVDDVLSLNKSYLGELEIKDTTDTAMSASYIDLLLAIGSEDWLRTKLK